LINPSVAVDSNGEPIKIPLSLDDAEKYINKTVSTNLQNKAIK
jgi:hypothetical protein